MTKTNLNLYLKRAEEFGVIPNFFMSEAYLKLCNVECIEKDGYIWIQDDDWCLFPPLFTSIVSTYPQEIKKIWSSFLQIESYLIIIDKNVHQFLDYNYIFRPTDFLYMYGGKWETFRKNCRKWPNQNEVWNYSCVPPMESSEAGKLIADWLENKGQTMQDGELLANFAFFNNEIPVFRKFLYKGNELVAINAWDENWMFLNYRVCIVKQAEPFLDEFVRWLFYTDSYVIHKNKLVNDGGVLDNPGLERFKDKMNPMEKHRIYSWIKK